MAKPRTTTLLEKHGFKDDDLKTPVHDEIMCWLTDNITSIIYKIVCGSANPMDNSAWREKQYDAYQKSASKQIEELEKDLESFTRDKNRCERETMYDRTDDIRQIMNNCNYVQACIARIKECNIRNEHSMLPFPIIGKPVWEVPVVNQRSHSRFTIGYLDLQVKVTELVLGYPEYGLSTYKSDPRREWKDLSTKENKKGEVIELTFEVKTKLPTLGELLRQINQYRLHLTDYRGVPFYIVAPSEEFTETARRILLSQNVGLVAYPDEHIETPNNRHLFV